MTLKTVIIGLLLVAEFLFLLLCGYFIIGDLGMAGTGEENQWEGFGLVLGVMGAIPTIIMMIPQILWLALKKNALFIIGVGLPLVILLILLVEELLGVI